MLKQLIASMTLFVMLASCTASSATEKEAAPAEPTTNKENTEMTDTTKDVKIAVETSVGNFTLLLYGDTPKHQQNFLKLVNDGTYDGTLFHRVIKDFMVQAGDPDSKTAQPGQRLGSGDLGYTVEAEFVYPKHFHKRGALAAARQGDQTNPERRSSGSQFYVVTGRKFSDGELDKLDKQAVMRQQQEYFNSLAKEHMAEIRQIRASQDREGLNKLQQQLIEQTEAWAKDNAKGLTDEQRQAYTTVGGAPHLDGQYTVYGEVIDGMDTIDKIEAAQTDAADRPTQDIRIISMKVVD